VFVLTQQVIPSTSIATINGTITGDIDTGLLASPVSFAAGLEYREFTATRQSDEASQTPGAVVGGGGAAPDINGSYDVFDAFGELVIPIFEGVPFAEQLTLELGGRYSDYSTAGTEFTWKAGGSWEPVVGLVIRGNYQRSSRAPNIGELFTPVSTGLSNLQTDPCQLALPVGNANLTAVCVAQGAPAGVIGLINPPPAGQINVTTGGNPNLGTETADTWTVGFVAQPLAVPGLSFSVDYWNIRVEDAIAIPAVIRSPPVGWEACMEEYAAGDAVVLHGAGASVASWLHRLGALHASRRDATADVRLAAMWRAVHDALLAAAAQARKDLKAVAGLRRDSAN